MSKDNIAMEILNTAEIIIEDAEMAKNILEPLLPINSTTTVLYSVIDNLDESVRIEKSIRKVPEQQEFIFPNINYVWPCSVI